MSLWLMRALVLGKVTLRGDLQRKLREDIEKKRWLTSAKGKVIIGNAPMEDTQNRLIYILEIPE